MVSLLEQRYFLMLKAKHRQVRTGNDMEARLRVQKIKRHCKRRCIAGRSNRVDTVIFEVKENDGLVSLTGGSGRGLKKD